MKNTKWVKNENGDFEWRAIQKDIAICTVYKEKNRYELPAAWFGRNKNHHLKSKKSLVEAKKACENWLNNFIKQIQ